MNDQAQPPPPQRLDYLTPQPPNPRPAILLAFTGFVVGVVAITLGGCGLFLVGGFPIAGGGPLSTPTHWWAPALFFAVVVVSLAGAVPAYRSCSKPWFLIGVLLVSG